MLIVEHFPLLTSSPMDVPPSEKTPIESSDSSEAITFHRALLLLLLTASIMSLRS